MFNNQKRLLFIISFRATGDNGVMGRIAKMTDCERERTLLQKEIDRFVWIIVTCAIFTATLVIAVWGAWLQYSFPTFMPVSQAVVNAIAVLVAFIPEGLPIAVTITLTLIAKRMSKRNVLVKNLTTVETLGAVDVILSDKTGTLTQNRMSVMRIGTANHEFTMSELRQRLLDTNRAPMTADLEKLVEGAILCNSANFAQDTPEDANLSVSERSIIGDATDSAVFRFGAEFRSVKECREGAKKLYEIPFNSRNKWMMTVNQPIKEDMSEAEPVMIMKGAPDILMPKCTHYLDHLGQSHPLSYDTRQYLLRMQEEWSSNGQRVLVMCRRMPPEDLLKELIDGNEDPLLPRTEITARIVDSLCFVGILGLVDPPKPEIRGVIQKCRQAGIRVMMVTGDFAGTAKAIARSIGLITTYETDGIYELLATSSNTVQFTAQRPLHQSRLDLHPQPTSIMAEDPVLVESRRRRSLVLNGGDLDKLNQADWRRITQYGEVVFARTTPEQKLMIVQEFRRNGHVVAVTGDGVNDAPALKAAHVGVAMGSGSDGKCPIHHTHLKAIERSMYYTFLLKINEMTLTDMISRFGSFAHGFIGQQLLSHPIRHQERSHGLREHPTCHRLFAPSRLYCRTRSRFRQRVLRFPSPIEFVPDDLYLYGHRHVPFHGAHVRETRTSHHDRETTRPEKRTYCHTSHCVASHHYWDD
jgi:sodium/potassium-transporting ATPase subunit alpha